VTLPRSAQAGLEQLAVECRHLAPREDVFGAGDAPRHVNLILEGWACRYVLLEDGRRQISAILLPGDLCDLGMSVLRAADHSVAALTAIRVAQIAPDRLRELAGAHPELEAALQWHAHVEQSIARAWIASIGQRSATERLAHLFCEVFVRLEAVGLVGADCCAFPLTQEQLADAVGISTVHVNRSLMDLRALGLIALKEKTLTILDREALMRLAMFDPTYLHFER
jgi:CRP-like cAMP-binding protein